MTAMSEKDIRAAELSPQGPVSNAESMSGQSIAARILTIARALGRHIAQEQLKPSQAANDNESDKKEKQDG